jgi:hypothetical protein
MQTTRSDEVVVLGLDEPGIGPARFSGRVIAIGLDVDPLAVE